MHQAVAQDQQLEQDAAFQGPATEPLHDSLYDATGRPRLSGHQL